MDREKERAYDRAYYQKNKQKRQKQIRAGNIEKIQRNQLNIIKFLSGMTYKGMIDAHSR